MRAIDRLMMRASKAGVFMTGALIDWNEELQGYDVRCDLWDGVFGSAMLRDDWRIRSHHATLEEAEAEVDAMWQKYPGGIYSPAIISGPWPGDDESWDVIPDGTA